MARLASPHYFFTTTPLVATASTKYLVDQIFNQPNNTTVESLNNGHIGGMAFVRCRETSASRRLVHIYTKSPSIHYLECSLHVLRLNSYRRKYSTPSLIRTEVFQLKKFPFGLVK